jgi:hypothetical protein
MSILTRIGADGPGVSIAIAYRRGFIATGRILGLAGIISIMIVGTIIFRAGAAAQKSNHRHREGKE